MALINCPECGKDMSDSLKKCPHCGYKIKNEKKLVDKKKIKKLIIPIVILLAVLIGSVTWIQVTKLTDKEKEQVESINDEIVEKLTYRTTDKSVPELNGYIEEYLKVVEKYKQLNWKQKIRVNGYSKIEDKISHVEREEINIVVNAIDEIGSVSIESRIKIESAEENYLALSDKQKSDVSNHAKLTSARKKYNELARVNM